MKSGLKKGCPKCENCTPVGVLARFSKFPGTPKNIANGTQMESTINKQLKKSEKLAVNKKKEKRNCHEVAKSIKITSTWGPRGGVAKAVRSSKIVEHNTSCLSGPDGRPRIQKASQRRPKGVQEVAKRHEKDIPKASTRQCRSGRTQTDKQERSALRF